MGMSMIDGRLVLTHELFTKMFKVGAPNNAPVAGNDSVSINEDTTTTINVIANDTDLDGHSLAVLSTSSPSNGSVILNANQTITYTPNLNFFGSDSFSYEVGDGRGGTAIGTVQISVNSVNDRPVASPQTFTVSEDVALNGQLTGADADGDSLTFQLVTGTTQGTVQFNNATGEFTYNPRANYFGADGFTFKVKDGFLDSEVVSVTIAVESVNDIPIAAPLSIQIDEDGIAEGQLSAEDVDNAILSFVGSSPSPGGSLEVASDGRFTYRPPQNFNGVASFSFQASDGLLMSLPASVTVTVRPVNDAPSLSEATFVIAENLPNGSQVGLVQATDFDSQILTYSISGTDAAPFIINSQTGALSVANSALLDYERQTDFVFFATVTDDLGAATSKLVRVRLTNLVDVQMDVLPGDSSNTINLASKEIEVALLGSYEFNPATIDLSRVRLQGPNSSTGSAIVRSGKNGYKTRFADVNNDGILDLVMAFNTNNTGLKVGDTFVKLTGIRATATGPVDFELTQTVRVINRRR
jgi:large repetitive protein